MSTAPAAPVFSPEDLVRELDARRQTDGCSVALANGCFDLLHPGHLSFLEGAAQEADVLVVGTAGGGLALVARDADGLTIESIEAISFPVWLFRVQAQGGEEVVIEPAAATMMPQLADLQLPAGELEPFHSEEEGVTAVPETIPLETARGWLEQRGQGHLTETALVRLPLWRCQYSFEGDTYQVLVDASTGAVMAAVFPEKAESPYYLVAGLGLVLFAIEGLAITNPVVKFVAYAITAVPLVLLAYWVARKI